MGSRPDSPYPLGRTFIGLIPHCLTGFGSSIDSAASGAEMRRAIFLVMVCAGSLGCWSERSQELPLSLAPNPCLEIDEPVQLHSSEDSQQLYLWLPSSGDVGEPIRIEPEGTRYQIETITFRQGFSFDQVEVHGRRSGEGEAINLSFLVERSWLSRTRRSLAEGSVPSEPMRLKPAVKFCSQL